MAAVKNMGAMVTQIKYLQPAETLELAAKLPIFTQHLSVHDLQQERILGERVEVHLDPPYVAQHL